MTALTPSHAPNGTPTPPTPDDVRHMQRSSHMSDTATLCRGCGKSVPLDILGYCPDCGDIAPPYTKSPVTSPSPRSTVDGNEAASPAASSTQHTMTNEGRRRIAPPDGPTTPGGTPNAANTD